MKRGAFIAALLLCGAARADSVTAAWSNLCARLRECAEATRYGQTVATNISGSVTNVVTNGLFLLDPVVVTQPMPLALGVVVTNTTDVFGGSIGPIVTETNISGSRTNVWTWTNKVQLTTGWFVWTNFLEGYQPYPQPVATNFVLNTPPSLLVAFTNLSATYAPDYLSAAAVWKMDEALRGMIEQHYWVDTVAVSNAGGLNAYLQSFTSTNWYWYDSDTNGTDDLWYAQGVHPLELPRLTVSNAWKYAGLERVEDFTVATVTNVLYGWQVGNLTAYTVTNVSTVTNYTASWTNVSARYGFPVAPTLTTYRATLAEASIVRSNIVAGGTTNVRLSLGPVRTPGGPRADGVMQSPWRSLTNSTTLIRWVPATTNAAPPEGLKVFVAGSVAMLSNGVTERSVARVETNAPTTNAVALANAFWIVGPVTSDWQMVTTNGDPRIAELAGSTVSIVWSNAYYTWNRSGGVLPISETNAVLDRWKVARQLIWTRLDATEIASPFVFNYAYTGWVFSPTNNGGDDPVNWNTTNFDTAVEYSRYEDTVGVTISGTNTPLDCPAVWPWGVYRTAAFSNQMTNATEPLYEGQYRAEVDGVVYCRTTYSYVEDVDAPGFVNPSTFETWYWRNVFLPDLHWPTYTYYCTNLAGRVAASCDFVALFGDEAGGLYYYDDSFGGGGPHRVLTNFPQTVKYTYAGVPVGVHDNGTASAGFTYGTVTNTITFTNTLAGGVAPTNVLRVWATVAKQATNATVTIGPLQFTDNATPYDGIQWEEVNYDYSWTDDVGNGQRASDYRRIARGLSPYSEGQELTRKQLLLRLDFQTPSP